MTKYFYMRYYEHMKKIIILFLSIMISAGQAMAEKDKTTYGYIEKATLLEKNLTVSAKLDTGAKSASLSAIKITPFEKNGKTFISFIVPSKQGDIPFEAEYVGIVKIKVRAQEKKLGQTHTAPIRRPVVLLMIKIGDKTREIPLNLTNRKRFNYPLLLGRDAIKSFEGIVDPSQVFMIKSTSKGKK